MAKNLEIVRGTTNAFLISLIDANGRPYTLETNQVLVFALKAGTHDDERLLVKKIVNTVDGEYYLELDVEDTLDLDPGRYYYDIGMQQGATLFFNVVKASPFDILPNVSQLGDGL